MRRRAGHLVAELKVLAPALIEALSTDPRTSREKRPAVAERCPLEDFDARMLRT